MGRYDLFQEYKYICGRKFDWEAIIAADFGVQLKNILKNIDWLGLVNLSEMN